MTAGPPRKIRPLTEAMRRCLGCGKDFLSVSKANRLCTKCREPEPGCMGLDEYQLRQLRP